MSLVRVVDYPIACHQLRVWHVAADGSKREITNVCFAFDVEENFADCFVRDTEDRIVVDAHGSLLTVRIEGIEVTVRPRRTYTHVALDGTRRDVSHSKVLVDRATTIPTLAFDQQPFDLSPTTQQVWIDDEEVGGDIEVTTTARTLEQLLAEEPGPSYDRSIQLAEGR